MTILEAISTTDTLKPNTYDQSDKVRWLSNLDGIIKRSIIDTHEGGEGVIFRDYDENTPLDTVLLVPSPFEDIYIKWLEAQIDYHNNEYARYNISATAYNNIYHEFTKHYKERHVPKQRSTRFLF